MRKHDDVYAVGESEIFHCNQNGAYGKGVLLDKKRFRVLAGSLGRIEVADSCPTQVKSLREKLIKAGRM